MSDMDKLYRLIGICIYQSSLKDEQIEAFLIKYNAMLADIQKRNEEIVELNRKIDRLNSELIAHSPKLVVSN